MTKLKEKLQTKGEILDKLYVQKTPHIQSRIYALGFQIIPSDSIGFRDKKASDSMGFCEKKCLPKK